MTKKVEVRINKMFLMLFVVIVFVEIIALTNTFSLIIPKKLAGTKLPKGELETYASQIIKKCSLASYKPSCYDKEIPQLMDTISMEDAFEVTRVIQDIDTSYPYCHVLGHNLSAKEARKDPDKWKEVVGRCPSGLCSNGCIHGSFQEKFRAEALPDAKINELKIELEGICETRADFNPTGLEQGSCYHALGHLTMYITGANIEKSLSLCDELAITPIGQDWSQLCYDGAFMQIFQPLEPEDFTLVEGKAPLKTDILSYCNKFSGTKREPCLAESWPLFREEILTSDGLVKFCSMNARSDQKRCYDGMFYVITAQLFLDSEKVIDFCSQMSTGLRDQCFSNAASRMIETDWRNIEKAVDLCTKANELGSSTKCYEELVFYSTYNFHAGSKEFFQLCSSLPDEWSESCLNRN